MILPPRIVGHGDVEKARSLMPYAKNQLSILGNLMSFQKLKQDVRRLEFADGTQIKCIINHWFSRIDIYCPQELEDTLAVSGLIEVPILTIVYGDSENLISYLMLEDLSGNGFKQESVFCLENGSGSISYIDGESLYGVFEICFPADTISSAEGTITGESSGCIGTITSCLAKVYDRLYENFYIFSNKTLSSAIHPMINISCFDISPLSNTQCYSPSCEGKVVDWWSKTYKDVIVTAFVHYPLGCDGGTFWSISVSYKDELVKFSSGLTYEPALGYARGVCTAPLCPVLTNTHIGFDVYSKIENGIESFYVGIIGDQEASLTVFKIDTTTLIAETILSIATNVHFEDEYIDISNNEWYIRLVGYGYTNNQHEIEFAAFGVSSETIKYIVTDIGNLSKEVTTRKDNIITALWNPLIKEAYYIQNDDLVTDDPLVSEYGSEPVAHWPLTTAIWCYQSSYYYPAEYCNNFEYLMDGWPGTIRIYDGKCVSTGLFAGGDTMAWLEYGTDTDYGNFYIGDSLLSMGAQTYFSTQKYKITTFNRTNFCTNVIDNIQAWCASTHEVPLDRKDYSFLGGIFTSTGISYKYKEINYVEMEKCTQVDGYCDDDKNTISIQECKTFGDGCPIDCYDSTCYCDEANWQEIEVSTGSESASINNIFPYDSGWKSILLTGTTVNSDYKNIEQTVSNWVIYKNIETDALYLVDDNGNKKEDILTERAFFKQQYITVGNEK